MMITEASTNYKRVEKAIQFMLDHQKSQPRITEIASHVGISEFHFNRLFKEWAGVTPKQFLQFLTLNHAKAILNESRTVLDTAYDVGLSSSGRLHDLFVTIDAVTPGNYRSNGRELLIEHGCALSPFGQCFIAATNRGICKFSFLADGQMLPFRLELQSEWPEAAIVENDHMAEKYAREIFRLDGAEKSRKKITLLLKGTNFQLKVWEALLRIPEGSLLSYADVASAIGKPESTRAVAGAIAKNPIGYLIPCHRVLRSSGELSGYRWGSARKAALLGWEASMDKEH